MAKELISEREYWTHVQDAALAAMDYWDRHSRIEDYAIAEVTQEEWINDDRFARWIGVWTNHPDAWQDVSPVLSDQVRAYYGFSSDVFDHLGALGLEVEGWAHEEVKSRWYMLEKFGDQRSSR